MSERNLSLGLLASAICASQAYSFNRCRSYNLLDRNLNPVTELDDLEYEM